MEPVLHRTLPFPPPWAGAGRARLPGTRPMDPRDWLLQDAAFAGQMALRDRLIADRPDDVHALTEPARAAADELLSRVLGHLSARPDYRFEGASALRPDGIRVAIDHGAPLLTLGRLVQSDFCLLLRQDAAHVLAAAILCFPASWTLSEKIGRPLGAIHRPVPSYDAGLAARVQRLFDALHPDRPLWRSNALIYADPTLFQPRSEAAPRGEPGATGAYFRSERQTLLRLPASGAVAFGIHTAVMRLSDIPADERAALLAHRTRAEPRA